MTDEYAQQWNVGMDSEYESIGHMDVYEMSELPEGCKAIGSK